MFNEQAFCPEVSGHAHRGAHSLNEVGGQESDFGGPVSGLVTSKRGGIHESYVSHVGEVTVQETVPEHKRVEECS